MLVNLLPVDLILVHWIKLYLCSSLEIFDIRVKTDRDEFIFFSSVMLVLHMLEKVAFVSRAPNSDEDFSESIAMFMTVNHGTLLHENIQSQECITRNKTIEGDVSKPRRSSLQRVQVLP